MLRLLISPLFWLFFLIPLGTGSWYYYKHASKQYESYAHFTIEENGKANVDPLGALTGLAGPVSSTRDALIIKDFIESREVIEQIKHRIDVKKLYAREDKDWLSRLEQDASIEDIVEYWKKKVRVDFDSASGITRLSVMAFEPQDAVDIIKEILYRSETLVNNLANKARQDSLDFARKELTKAEAGLKLARSNVTKFREKDSITPVVVVPTSFNSVTTDEFAKIGVNVVIYANHMLRAAYPGMMSVAKSILKNKRTLEAEPDCMKIKDILELIPGTK